MLPSSFVVLETLPLTANGKIDRRALPAPEEQHEQAGSRLAAEPRDQLEELLFGIWKEVLGKTMVSRDDHFFAQGGHSLLATRLVARARGVLGVEVGVKTVFEKPTLGGWIAEVEALLRGGERAERWEVQPVARGSAGVALSFAQQRLWFLEQLKPGSTAYLIPSAQRLQGRVDQQALERSIQELVQRHESLRTTFGMQDGQPVQHIAQQGAVGLPVVDLRALGEEEREEQARQLGRQEREQGFDLQRGPLLRIWLLCLGEQEHVLLMAMHHIISDGWSSEIIGQELGVLYEAFAQGQASPLPALPIQYADYAMWQRSWLQGAVLEQQVAYWREALAGVQPLNCRRIICVRHCRRSEELPYGGDASRVGGAVAGMSQKEEVTLFMLLLTAFQVLLARYSGQEDIAVGTAIANRRHREVEGLIGFFVNTLVLRTQVRGEERLCSSCGQVRKVALGAYAHQDVPFEHLVEVLRPERDLSRTPFFQVALGFSWEDPETRAEANSRYSRWEWSTQQPRLI